MNYEHSEYLPWIVLSLAIFIFLTLWLEKKFFKVVKLYWFYNRSFFSYLSTFLFISGISLLVFSLVDLRGPEEKIKAGIPTQRTIILMDTSASMLAEDVKPSRLQKAALIAKHFARKAAGQQLSIVAFAEIQKKIVPFTNDLDLIDARLESIKNLRNQNGSSALTAAIQESIQYFKETGEARGNILVITDGEETAEDIGLNVPKEINLALVGVGTNQGGRIPLDDGRGFRFGYKKNRGQDVITKLNEGFFKKIAADVPSGKYWIANTYTLPSDEILDFFKGEGAKGGKEQDMVIKPVMMEWAVVPALLLLILSYFMKVIRVFSLGVLLIISPVKADEKELREYSPEILRKMELLQKGDLSQLEKIKLADELQKAGAHTEALALYNENLSKDSISKDIPPEAYLNYATALLEKGEGQKGLETYENLLSSLDPNSDKAKKVKEIIENNILNYFKVQEEKKQQQKKDQEKENKENKENKEKDNSQQQNSGEGKDKQQKGGNTKDPKDKKDSQDKDQNQKDKKDSDQEKDDEKNKDEDKKEENKNNEQSSNEENKQKLPPQKVSPKLKQLLSDDRQLQLKIIEQSTRDMNRRKSRENKDW